MEDVEEAEYNIEDAEREQEEGEVGAEDEAEEAEAGGGEVEEEEGEDDGEAANETANAAQDLLEVEPGGDDEDGGDWSDGDAEGPPLPDIPPQHFDHPPWPPLPRKRLLGTGGPPAIRRKKKASPQAVRPPLDVPGRLVSVGEAIKFILPEDQGGERRGGVMSATVLHTAKTVQKRYPNDYNIRTQDRVDMSIQLTAMQGWWVFRRGRWYPGNHPDPPPPDSYPEHDDGSSGEDQDEEVNAQGEGGAAGGAQH